MTSIKDNLWQDISEELDVAQDNIDAIDNILDKVYTENLGVISDEISKQYAIELSEDQIERIILDFELDITSEHLTEDVHNIYTKDYS